MRTSPERIRAPITIRFRYRALLLNMIPTITLKVIKMPTARNRMITVITNKVTRIATARSDMTTRATCNPGMNTTRIRDGGLRNFRLPVIASRRVCIIRATMIV